MMGGKLGRVSVVDEVSFYWEVVVEGGLQGKGRVLLTRMVIIMIMMIIVPGSSRYQIRSDLMLNISLMNAQLFIFVVIYLRWPQINWTLSISCKKRKVY